MTVSGHHALSEETSSGSAQPETGLCFSDLRAGYGDAADILSGLRLQLDPGAFTVLLGASGSGKTTLIKSAVGLVQPRSGCIELGGKSLLGRKSGATRRRISMIHQDFGLAPRLSVIQNVMAGVSAETSFLRVLFQAYPKSVQARAVEMLLSVGLQPEQFDRRARELGDGHGRAGDGPLGVDVGAGGAAPAGLDESEVSGGGGHGAGALVAPAGMVGGRHVRG